MAPPGIWKATATLDTAEGAVSSTLRGSTWAGSMGTGTWGVPPAGMSPKNALTLARASSVSMSPTMDSTALDGQ